MLHFCCCTKIRKASYKNLFDHPAAVQRHYGRRVPGCDGYHVVPSETADLVRDGHVGAPGRPAAGAGGPPISGGRNGRRVRGCLQRDDPEQQLGHGHPAACTERGAGALRSYDYLLAFVAIPVGDAVAGPLQSAFGADAVLFGAGATIAVANFVPAVLPAVPAVVRQKDGTITGPPARRKVPAMSQPATQAPAVSD
jgi:hypothetical protein